MKTVSTVLCAFALLLLSGCMSTQESHTRVGFLDNYDRLAPVKGYDDALAYTTPRFNRDELKNVEKVYFVPFTFRLQPVEGVTENKQELQKASQYLNDKLLAVLKKHFQVVDKPGKGVLTIEGVLTDMQVNDPGIGAADFIPVRAIINAGNAAYLAASKQKDVVTKMGMEARFSIDESMQEILAFTSYKTHAVTVSDSPEARIEAARALMDQWAAKFDVAMKTLGQRQ